jgi:hypothetical protein
MVYGLSPASGLGGMEIFSVVKESGFTGSRIYQPCLKELLLNNMDNLWINSDRIIPFAVEISVNNI